MLLGQLEVLIPDCNLETLSDGRGGIFSWVPKDDIKEFTLLYFNPGKIRGNHFHPEFIEYFLILQGNLVLSTVDANSGKLVSSLVGAGFCFRTPSGVSHALQAITYSVGISLITKPWNSCKEPIVYKEVI